METKFKVQVDNIVYQIYTRELLTGYIFYEICDERKTICTIRHEINQLGKLIWTIIENRKDISHRFAARIGDQIDNYYT